jgi:hypothetical protein
VVLNVPGGGDADLPSAPPPESIPANDADPPALATTVPDDPDLDGVDDIAALAAKMTELGVERCQHQKLNRCRLCGVERKRDVSMVDGEPVWVVAWKPIPKSALRDGKDAWLVLLRAKLPEMANDAFDELSSAPIEEIRGMVATL